MENILSITRHRANTKITSAFLLRGDNIYRFRGSYGRLQRKVREGSTITAIHVNKVGVK